MNSLKLYQAVLEETVHVLASVFGIHDRSIFIRSIYIIRKRRKECFIFSVKSGNGSKFGRS